MDHLVLNPEWNVPDTILIDDIVPRVREEPVVPRP
jgi:murein L,D-transpeptidase YcbB/YkuD